MREVHVDEIILTVRQLCIDANIEIRPDTLQAYRMALDDEESEVGREVLELLIRNAEVAKAQRLPFCQDTGYAVLFVELGQEVHFLGGSLSEAFNEGVRQGYRDGFLRKSLVRNPCERENTGDNTPAVINTVIVSGDRIKIDLLIKGAGCDNVSALKMFTPAEGLEAAKDFIVETADMAGPNASPPFVIGVGMGGPFARAALLAQKALLWPVGTPNPDSKLNAIEKELMERINSLGIGPAGFGGRVTTLGVHIEAFATHIASFPVAVNIDCHSHRGKGVVL
ncbi:Fumarate hydratase class I, alpha region (EC; L(+)-tartrate dehydratase alpha subunit (EC [Olavius sp. associated proteobacterium Delta 1]|nr:Fumarate hydratase class I, alpha region (EC; L(+)-tartrate dehydratase alpha subunit (EC [Olavius sp. associated proteobacterium Delta 1]